MLRWYKPKIDKAKKIVDEMYRKGTTIEDDDAIAVFISPTKMEITPKKATLEELNKEFVEKLNKRHLLKYIAVYTENGRLYLEKMMI